MTEIPRLKAHGVDIAELEDKREEIRENRRELRLAQSQLPRLEQGVEHARLEDTRAAVKARREGKNDPGPKHEEKAQAELDRVRREVAVFEGLDAELVNEAHEILREHAEEISEGLQATLREVNDTQLAALAEVEAARAHRLQLQTVLGQVAAVVPPQAEAQAEAGDYVEVLVHHDAGSIYRVDEGQVKKVLGHLRFEAGDATERDELAARENPPDDVFFAGAGGLTRPAGYQRFKERQAERQ